MLHTYTQDKQQPIAADRPNQVVSVLDVGTVTGKLVRVSAVLDLHHNDRRDLRVTLHHGDQKWILHDRKAQALRNFRFTVDVPKFDPSGEWRLVIQDLRKRDGGRLYWWRLELETVGSDFSIDVRFVGGLTASQRSVFSQAAERWADVITGDLPEATIGQERIDDVLIYAEGRIIDGPGSVLGQAGPTHLRQSSMLPIAGSMAFDSEDLAAMEAQGILLPVIIHEMGHVLGIGTLWRIKGLIEGSGTDDPRFVGAKAVAEWEKLTELHNGNFGKGVPLANTGGPGTREGHWRESVFNDELMTGYVDAGLNPMSRVTIASLADIGYEVNLDAADSFITKALSLAASYVHRQCSPARCNPVIVEGT